MADQAERLRQLSQAQQTPSGQARLLHTRLVAVGSGKGGVGKSNVSLNVALAMQASGWRVAIIDGDLGFSNLEILLGVRPTHSLQDVFRGQVDLRTASICYKDGLTLISGGSGVLPEEQIASLYLARFAHELSQLDGQFDYLFIDFGAGFGRYSAEMMSLCDEMLLVTTPEPTSLTDGYALVKMMMHGGRVPHLRLLVNRARNISQAQDASDKFVAVATRFLDLKVEALGFVMEDEAVPRAVSRQIPFVLGEPHAVATRCVQRVAAKGWPPRPQDGGSAPVPPPPKGIRAFWERFAARK